MGIEFHHIHHLTTRVPGYVLAECHAAAPPGAWDAVTRVGLRLGLASLCNVMWNEERAAFEPFWPLPPQLTANDACGT
jgi:omega-6 fatty acid desaturase (delta-12 desaturase)